MNDDLEPAYAEALARLEVLNPQPVIRPCRVVHLYYRPGDDGVWRVSSPELVSLDETGPTREAAERLVTERLGEWLDPDVEVRHCVIGQAGTPSE